MIKNTAITGALGSISEYFLNQCAYVLSRKAFMKAYSTADNFNYYYKLFTGKSFDIWTEIFLTDTLNGSLIPR